MRKKLSVASGAACGRGHDAVGLPCQDFVASKKLTKKSGLVVLADGAGSAPYSAIGAKCTVEYVVCAFESILMLSGGCHDQIKELLVLKLQEELEAQAIRLNTCRKDLACTLQFVYAKQENHGTKYIIGHIGDGIIVSHCCDESQILSFPDNGEYINSTMFVTDDNAVDRLRIQSGKFNGRDVMFALMSDGVANSVHRRHDNVIAPVIGSISGWGRKYSSSQIRKALQENLVAVFKPCTSDDCSMGLLFSLGYERFAKGKG